MGHLTISFIHELKRLKKKAVYKTCFKNSDMRAELNVYQCNLKLKKYLNHFKKNAINQCCTMICQYMCLHCKSRINYSLLTLYIDNKNLRHETIY